MSERLDIEITPEPTAGAAARSAALEALGDDAASAAAGALRVAPTGRRASRLMFAKVLVANRGEIAIRVFRTLREMGIGSRGGLLRGRPRRAVRALRRRGVPDRRRRRPPQSYLHVETRSRGGAQRAGAEAVHPGYGFLAENAPFARACAAAGLTFDRPAAGRHRGDGLEDQRPRS